jgi:two-component system copper resistance phosphate regulon response regulator CusR
MKLIIVEPDTETCGQLSDSLAREGFSADTVCTGEEAIRLASQTQYALVILDTDMPSRDGFSILKELRDSGDRTPVLFISARTGVEDRIRGLELGAEGYLVKPFSVAELAARARAILRRMPPRQPQDLRVADLKMDLLRQRAFRHGSRLSLTPKEFNLLSLLARRQGEVLTRETIAEQVWDAPLEVGSNVVDVHVRRLRAKLDDPFQTKLVHTVRGMGYVLREPERVGMSA